MQVDDYRKLFTGFIDNNILNGSLILCGNKLKQEEKNLLLEEVAYRIQIEYHKNVYLVTTNSNVITELPSIIKPQNPYDIPGHFNRNNTVFLTDITFPYFDNPESWESRIVKVLTDYFYTIIGFSSSKQIIKLYENL